MRILASLGATALLRREQATEVSAQQHNLRTAAAALASLAGEHELVLIRGFGPQPRPATGLSEGDRELAPESLDPLDTRSEGKLGRMLELALHNALPDRDLATVLTEVIVSADAPSFSAPSQQIGPLYSASEARRLAAERGWTFEADGGGKRRLVPSPEPSAITQLRSLRLLIDAGVLVICAGAGGMPVLIDETGAMRGVEAVVDQDLTAALLARRLDADLLLLLTDRDAVRLDPETDQERPLRTVSPKELREAKFAIGSMAPKVEAARRFVEATGRRAAIGALRDAVEVARGGAGTQISGEPA